MRRSLKRAQHRTVRRADGADGRRIRQARQLQRPADIGVAIGRGCTGRRSRACSRERAGFPRTGASRSAVELGPLHLGDLRRAGGIAQARQISGHGVQRAAGDESGNDTFPGVDGYTVGNPVAVEADAAHAVGNQRGDRSFMASARHVARRPKRAGLTRGIPVATSPDTSRTSNGSIGARNRMVL